MKDVNTDSRTNPSPTLQAAQKLYSSDKVTQLVAQVNNAVSMQKLLSK